MDQPLPKNTLTAVCVLLLIELCLQTNEINDCNDGNPAERDSSAIVIKIIYLHYEGY
jgi:hypothetical protein